MPDLCSVIPAYYPAFFPFYSATWLYTSPLSFSLEYQLEVQPSPHSNFCNCPLSIFCNISMIFSLPPILHLLHHPALYSAIPAGDPSFHYTLHLYNCLLSTHSGIQHAIIQPSIPVCICTLLGNTSLLAARNSQPHHLAIKVVVG
jgi:hypothetical protein